jgi:cytochrome c biogenesis protein CcmG, thiol:disulfide interchange protein DsbE
MAVPEFYSGKLLYPAIGVLIGLSALFGIAIRPRLVPQGGGMVGKPAPPLSLPVAANGTPGASMTLADLKGHPVLLDFWASWCGPCAMEAPVVDRVARRYEKKGLTVLGVNVSDTPAVVRAYAAQKGLSYPMVLDPGSNTSNRYGVQQLPSLIVIDKEGNVFAFLTGFVDEASLNDIVEAAM